MLGRSLLHQSLPAPGLRTCSAPRLSSSHSRPLGWASETRGWRSRHCAVDSSRWGSSQTNHRGLLDVFTETASSLQDPVLQSSSSFCTQQVKRGPALQVIKSDFYFSIACLGVSWMVLVTQTTVLSGSRNSRKLRQPKPSPLILPTWAVTWLQENFGSVWDLYSAKLGMHTIHIPT